MSGVEIKKGWVIQQIVEHKDFVCQTENGCTADIKQAHVYDTREQARTAKLLGEETVRRVQLDKKGEPVKILC